MVQIMKENTLPRKILLYGRSTLHFADPQWQDMEDEDCKKRLTVCIRKSYALQATYVVKNSLH